MKRRSGLPSNVFTDTKFVDNVYLPTTASPHSLCTTIIMLIVIRHRWSCSFMQMFISVHRKTKKYNDYRRKTESVKRSSVIRRLKVTAEFRRKYQKSFDIMVTSYKTEQRGTSRKRKKQPRKHGFDNSQTRREHTRLVRFPITFATWREMNSNRRANNTGGRAGIALYR